MTQKKEGRYKRFRRGTSPRKNIEAQRGGEGKHQQRRGEKKRSRKAILLFMREKKRFLPHSNKNVTVFCRKEEEKKDGGEGAKEVAQMVLRQERPGIQREEKINKRGKSHWETLRCPPARKGRENFFKTSRGAFPQGRKVLGATDRRKNR